VEEFAYYLLQGLLADSTGDDLREIELCVASGPGQKGCASWSKP
jgi:6-pyruvoyltetrahydropterin/6-carboxytetrahydropterin synthase